MVKTLLKTDTHAVSAPLRTAGPGSPPVYGENVYFVYNKRTGEEVERFGSFGAALAGQVKYDAHAKTHGL